MALLKENAFKIPYQNDVLDESGSFTTPWINFFRTFYKALYPLGIEVNFTIVNNQSTAANIDQLQFNYTLVNAVIVEYVVQRCTTGAGTTELIEAGAFYVIYKPISATWVLFQQGSTGPSAGGVTFTVTSKGQVQYTSTNITGTQVVSKVAFRTRILNAQVTL